MKYLTKTRLVIYGGLVIFFAIAFAIKGLYLKKISDYKRGADRLEIALHNDKRFVDVRVRCYETTPKAFVFAPTDLSSNDRIELDRLVTNAFGSLPVRILKGESSRTNKNTK